MSVWRGLRSCGTAEWTLCLLMLPILAGSAAPAHAERSEAGRFLLTWEARLAPLIINKMHAWMLTVQDASGAPVPGAYIEVTGGMPAHDHGLPTAPRITRDLGDGRYVLDGMKFHMAGHWQLDFTIAAAGETDRVTVELEVQ